MRDRAIRLRWLRAAAVRAVRKIAGETESAQGEES